jgi:hypothetical protein
LGLKVLIGFALLNMLEYVSQKGVYLSGLMIHRRLDEIRREGLRGGGGFAFFL